MYLKKHTDEYTCPVCGEVFLCYMKSQWTYKACFGRNSNLLVYCSWGCFQKARREHEAELARRRRKKNKHE